MPRRDLVRGLERQFFGTQPGRWLRAAGFAALASTAAVLVCWPGQTSSRVRTAIRVSCEQARACALAEAIALDVWSEHRAGDEPIDVVVDDRGLARLRDAGVTWQTLVTDIDAAARAEAMRLAEPSAARPQDWFAEYKDFAAVAAYAHGLAEQYPGRVTIESIGTSVQGRPIWALRIGGGSANATRMLINGTQHAREWISTMVTICVADRLVRGYDSNPAIRAFVDATELWVVPIVNPDGYEYSWRTDRYWRKNRRARFGVDLNRNFSVAFGGAGSSGSERSQTYRGPHAFSEPETAALRDLVRRERFVMHVDFHSYGQLLLFPWAYTRSPSPDRDRFAAIGDRMASAMFERHQTRYRLESGADLYPAAGTMLDWMYGEARALSFTIELRPRGGSGFVLPPEQIRPTCDEGLAGVLALRGHSP